MVIGEFRFITLRVHESVCVCVMNMHKPLRISDFESCHIIQLHQAKWITWRQRHAFVCAIAAIEISFCHERFELFDNIAINALFSKKACEGFLKIKQVCCLGPDMHPWVLKPHLLKFRSSVWLMVTSSFALAAVFCSLLIFALITAIMVWIVAVAYTLNVSQCRL